MTLQSPSLIHIDNGVKEEAEIGGTVYFSQKNISGVIQKVGKSYFVIETELGVMNVAKNKCQLLKEEDLV